MRWIKKIIYILSSIALLLALVIVLYLASLKPQYSGSVQVKGLQSMTEILFDSYGIPHIYAKNEEDAYLALGYLHAQERLFQMEMIRRIATGRLSEVFGRKYVPIDKFFKTLCLEEHSIASANSFIKDSLQQGQKAAIAYLNGINRYIESGRTPIEFTMLDIPKETYKLSDLFLTVDYMAFNFAMGFKTDPIMSYIYKKFGQGYLKDIIGSYKKGTMKIPIYIKDTTSTSPLPIKFESTASILDQAISPPIVGSNSWVLAPKKSKSGKVLFANDAHISFGQPCIWYEAHLEYPGFSCYGNYLAGFPFAAIGHTQAITWGLTMLMNDDIDFYREKVNPENKFEVWDNGHWATMKVIEKNIQVKQEADRECIVRITKRGPLMQGVMPEWKYVTTEAVSLWWTHLKFSSNMMDVTYRLNHAKSIDEVRSAASSIISPGLNIMYGDSTGNIAWWAAARLINRPTHVNPTLLLDGVSGKDDPIGFYDFSYNPKSENPPTGFLYSANNQPDSIKSFFLPGYYVPDDRAQRINQLLTDREKYGADDFLRINVDALSNTAPKVAQNILSVLSSKEINKTSTHNNAYYKLLRWNGDHKQNNEEPAIYYRLIYYILKYALKDEMGETNFQTYLQTHAMKNALESIIQNDSSQWWDDISTRNKIEKRKEIFNRAYDRTISDLVNELGSSIRHWSWGNVHVLEHVHPIGMKKPLNFFFNVGPFPVAGGNETINNAGFDLTNKPKYNVRFGPSMRIVLDFANIENSQSVLPTGQSGNLMSTNYKNQAPLYNAGKLRGQKMNKQEINSKKSGRLLLLPAR